MKKFILALCLLAVACGKKGPPELSSPADGQVVDLQTFTTLQVQIANNDYQGVTIEFRGIEGDLAREVRCDNTNNSPYAQCYKTQQQGFGGGFGACSPTAPCTVVIIAKNDNGSTVRTLKFQRGTAAPAPAPR